MTDLAQDVKEAMTGGSVAVIGTNAVDESNIKNKVINANKTNFLKIGKNKFNYQNVQEYMTIDSQGELISSPNRYLVSEKIYTGDATNLTVSYITSSNNQILLDNAIIAFYDSNSQYISKLTGAKVSIPENSYFCYCVLNTSYAEGDARQRVQIELEAEMSKFERYYEKLNDIGIDTILDDRNERPGVKFNDMDLIGTPIRITVGKKVEEDTIELKKRNEEEVKVIPIEKLIDELMEIGVKGN